jgi:hypothetical protein
MIFLVSGGLGSGEGTTDAGDLVTNAAAAAATIMIKFSGSSKIATSITRFSIYLPKREALARRRMTFISLNFRG